MSTSSSTVRERIMRAMTLALHAATGEQESRAAILGVLRIARAEKLDAEAFASVLGGDRYDDDEEEEEDVLVRPFACDIPFPFGKHKGLTLAQIARKDFGYLRWIATKFGEEGDAFRDSANRVLEFISRGGRP